MKKLVLIFIGMCSFFVSCHNDQSLTQLMPDSSFIIENETAYSDIFKRAKKLSQEAKEVIESESSKANKSSERVKNHLSKRIRLILMHKNTSMDYYIINLK